LTFLLRGGFVQRFILFGLAALARALGMALDQYGDWLLQRLIDGADDALDLMHDLWQFGRALVTALAEQLLGRGGRGVRQRQDDEWQPAYYGR
jgi:hypothetical protein